MSLASSLPSASTSVRTAPSLPDVPARPVSIAPRQRRDRGPPPRRRLPPSAPALPESVPCPRAPRPAASCSTSASTRRRPPQHGTTLHRIVEALKRADRRGRAVRRDLRRRRAGPRGRRRTRRRRRAPRPAGPGRARQAAPGQGTRDDADRHPVGVIVDISRKRVLLDGESAGLTYKEFELLQYLVLREGRTIERARAHRLAVGRRRRRGAERAHHRRARASPARQARPLRGHRAHRARRRLPLRPARRRLDPPGRRRRRPTSTDRQARSVLARAGPGPGVASKRGKRGADPPCARVGATSEGGAAMRFASAVAGGIRVFAVTGTNTISFGIDANAASRAGLLGFAVERIDPTEDERFFVQRVQGLPLVVPSPDEYDGRLDLRASDPEPRLGRLHGRARATRTATSSIRSPATPKNLDRSRPVVAIDVETEPLYGRTPADARRLLQSRRRLQPGATRGGSADSRPDEQPTAAKRKKALAWLSRDLDDAMLRFIRSARPGDAIRGCFYEFGYRPVLDELKAAIDQGVDVQLVVDLKVNEHTLEREAARRHDEGRLPREQPAAREPATRSRRPGSPAPRSSRGRRGGRPSPTTSSWCC